MSAEPKVYSVPGQKYVPIVCAFCGTDRPELVRSYPERRIRNYRCRRNPQHAFRVPIVPVPLPVVKADGKRLERG